LSGINTVYFSAAGLLNRIAFHALPVTKGILLMDKLKLRQLTSVRQLATPVKPASETQSIKLFGDCLFTISGKSKTSNNKVSPDIDVSPAFRSGNNTPWDSLPGSADEVKALHSLFQNAGWSSQLYTREQATEEKLKALDSSSTSILHIASHAFFIPDAVSDGGTGGSQVSPDAFKSSEDPMLRNGLILAGANCVWSGKGVRAGDEDGIVTAYEVAQLDLSKTELAVLSACQTALGDLLGAEGVFGLQRAFKMAGVKKMIVSLWPVPDIQTGELMISFYTHYLKTKDIRTAFEHAQKLMRDKYAEDLWAAFVLLE
jgi:CHAT domain-containing protein